MYVKKEQRLPLGGAFIEAVEIERQARVENPSLQMKLHGELAKDSRFRKDAADPQRIGRLKANGLRGGRSLCDLH